ncbi:MAG: hypothetical protein ACYCT7_09335 [bacterium]
MSSNGCAPLSDIFKMLDNCASGHTRKAGDHYWVIKFNGKIYYTLPKGEHGSKNPDIEIGHIKKLIRHLGIDEDCAKKYLSIL